jgi:hypothetical protein
MTRGGLSPASAFGFGAAFDSGPIPANRGPQGRAQESWTVTEADIDAWLKTAQVGDTFVYCHGPDLIRGGAYARVQALVTSGDVIPHHRRANDGGFDYFVRRNRVRVVTPRICDPMMMSVLLVVQDAAQDGRRCPSDAQIGEAADLSPDQVKWCLKKLDAAGFITRKCVPVPGDARFRVVKVIATGCETAGPGSDRPANPTGGRR